MDKKVLIGCSHVLWFKELEDSAYSNDHWHLNEFSGVASMPIFHEKMIDMVETANKNNDTVFLFPFRSIAYNRISDWMEESLKLDDAAFYANRMSDKLMQSARDAENKNFINKKLLKDERVVDIQNRFYKRWLEFYKKYDNVKFIFWCHFGAWWGADEGNEKNVFLNHISYPELTSMHPDKHVDMVDFANNFDGELFSDHSFHPTTACRLAFVKYLEAKYD